MFVGWESIPAVASCFGRGLCTFTLTADTTVTGVFELPQALTTTVVGDGQGSVETSDYSSLLHRGLRCEKALTENSKSCTISYSYGTEETLTAVPAGGSKFVGWSGACAGTGTCTVLMDRAQDVTASFFNDVGIHVNAIEVTQGIQTTELPTRTSSQDTAVSYTGVPLSSLGGAVTKVEFAQDHATVVRVYVNTALPLDGEPVPTMRLYAFRDGQMLPPGPITADQVPSATGFPVGPLGPGDGRAALRAERRLHVHAAVGVGPGHGQVHSRHQPGPDGVLSQLRQHRLPGPRARPGPDPFQPGHGGQNRAHRDHGQLPREPHPRGQSSDRAARLEPDQPAARSRVADGAGGRSVPDRGVAVRRGCRRHPGGRELRRSQVDSHARSARWSTRPATPLCAALVTQWADSTPPTPAGGSRVPEFEPGDLSVRPVAADGAGAEHLHPPGATRLGYSGGQTNTGGGPGAPVLYGSSQPISISTDDRPITGIAHEFHHGIGLPHAGELCGSGTVGTAQTVTGSTTAGSSVLTLAAPASGLAVGQPVTGAGWGPPANSTTPPTVLIKAINGSQLTMTLAATSTTTNASYTFATTTNTPPQTGSNWPPTFTASNGVPADGLLDGVGLVGLDNEANSPYVFRGPAVAGQTGSEIYDLMSYCTGGNEQAAGSRFATGTTTSASTRPARPSHATAPRRCAGA